MRRPHRVFRDELGEERRLVLQQLGRRVALHGHTCKAASRRQNKKKTTKLKNEIRWVVCVALTVVEEKDHVAVEDRRDPVRDGDDRRLRELLPKRLLDQVVCCGVH